MSTAVTLPQARNPLGYALMTQPDGSTRRVPVEIDMEWMRAFIGLVNRTGGTSGGSGFEDFLASYFDMPPHDQAGQLAIRGVDELRNELASARSDAQRLQSMVDALSADLAQLRPVQDLRNRVETLEDRFP